MKTKEIDPVAKAKVQQLSDNLQIPLYIRPDGTVHQHPPGERIDPDPKAGPNFNHGKVEETKSENG